MILIQKSQFSRMENSFTFKKWVCECVYSFGIELAAAKENIFQTDQFYLVVRVLELKNVIFY